MTSHLYIKVSLITLKIEVNNFYVQILILFGDENNVILTFMYRF